MSGEIDKRFVFATKSMTALTAVYLPVKLKSFTHQEPVVESNSSVNSYFASISINSSICITSFPLSANQLALACPV